MKREETEVDQVGGVGSGPGHVRDTGTGTEGGSAGCQTGGASSVVSRGHSWTQSWAGRRRTSGGTEGGGNLSFDFRRALDGVGEVW